MSSGLEYWHHLEISGSGQPILRESERDIYVEQSVGLYHGKAKILNKQKGRLYLTSQRIIYVDEHNAEKESVCIEVDDVLNIEYSSRFLKRSAKIIIFFKDNTGTERLIDQKRTGTTKWKCSICLSDNEFDGIFESSEKSMPPCCVCGVSVDKDMVEDTITLIPDDPKKIIEEKNICHVCTFINHPQLRNCEVCGTRLKKLKNISHQKDFRVEMKLEEGVGKVTGTPFAQLSFRKTDGTIFFEALEKLVKDVSISRSSHLFNQNAVSVNGVSTDPVIDPDLILINNDMRLIGITALEKNREQQLLKNNIVMSNALSDLNKLMALATDIEKIYEGNQKSTNKESLLIIDREKYLNKEVFLQEIAREIYGFVESELKGDGGFIVTLVDLYALYNKSIRIGTGLISPREMRDACEKFSSLGLHGLKLIKINGRVLCLAFHDSFDYITTKILQLVTMKPGIDILQITTELSQYDSNNWSIGVLAEVLQYCVTKGDLLIDEQITGINYYFNSFWKV